MKTLTKRFVDKPFHIYTVLYVIAVVPIMLLTMLSGKIVIGGTDGICQHYNAMLYISTLYKDVLYNFFHCNYVIPMFDFSLGCGDDILTTMNYYGLGDPFYLLTVFANEKTMPYFFTALFYLRLYLAGIAFILMYKRVKPDKKTDSYVAAAFLYCFSGFALESNTHIIFIHAMMYLPLIIWAIDRCLSFEKYSKRILIISVMMLSMTNIYFLYIISVVAVILTFYLGFFEYDVQIVKRIFTVAFSYLAGVLCASVCLIPCAMAILSSNRRGAAGIKEYIGLYSWDEYRNLFYSFFYVSDYTRLTAAIPIAGVIAVLFVFLNKQYKREQIWCLICIIAGCLPVVSWFMSGMGGNVYSRWELAIALYFSGLLISVWDEMILPQRKHILIAFAGVIILVMIGVVDSSLSLRCYRNSILGYGIVLFLLIYFNLSRNISISFRSGLLLLVVVACSVFTWKTNVVSCDITNVEKQKTFSNIESLYSDDFYRVDNADAYNFSECIINDSAIFGHAATTEYYSIVNSGYVDGRYKQSLGDSYLITGNDGRSILQRLSGVRYIIGKHDSNYMLPYGYLLANCDEETDSCLWENEDSLPLAYIYNDCVNHESFENMCSVQKQRSMVEAISLERYDEGEASYDYVCQKSNIDIEILEDNCSMRCVCPGGKESYLVSENYDITGYVTINGYTKPYWGNGISHINLGYYSEDTEVVIQFSSYDSDMLDNLYVETLNVKEEYAKLDKLSDNGECYFALNRNAITGTIEIDSDKYICLSVPYSKGWRAYIDGEQTELYAANDLYSGIPVPAGNHTVELKYSTPGLKTGAIISLVTLMVLAIMMFCIKKERME